MADYAVTENSSKEAVNAANQKMRSQPWYQQWFQSKGLDPNHVKLSDTQRKELAVVAAQNGMPLGNGEMIDPAGNFHTQTGFAGWPTWAKIAAAAVTVGGAAIAAPAIAGVIGGIGGGGGGTAATSGLIPAATDASYIGDAVSGVAASGVPGGIGSTLGTIGGILGKAGPALAAGGKAIGAATNAAGQNRVNQGEFDLQANSAYETELMNRAKQEAAQRSQANKDVYRSNFFKNDVGSPYDPRPPQFGSQMMSTLGSQADQGASKLAAPSQYDTTTMAPLTKAKIPPQSTLEQIGQWASPVMSTLGAIGSVA